MATAGPDAADAAAPKALELPDPSKGGVSVAVIIRVSVWE